MSLSAIVLAAGKGTRMRSPRSKLLHPLLGEALVFYPLRALHAAGVRQFVIVVGHAAHDVEAAIRAMPFLADAKLCFAVQGAQQGTGHAVQVALAASTFNVSEWLIVCGDSPHLDAATCKALLLARKRSKAAVAVLSAEVAAPSGYGRLVCVGKRVARIVEERDASDAERAITLVNAGAYAVEAAYLKKAIRALEPKNAQKELYLTDIVHDAAYLCAQSADVVLGVNAQADLAHAHAILQAGIVRAWQEQGVSIEPGDTVIGPRVQLSAGVIVERGATLLGATRVGECAVIEHHAHLHDVTVAAAARVRAFSYTENATIGERAQVGPVSRLRAGAVIEAEAEIGNFCEVKKTIVRARAKAHHVSYLGDAEIGAGTNIGAGTIICNYDGFNKPHSHIGADVFIGSNATLVAPVQIGDRAYVAAGSVITEAVTADTLAFGRARQVNKDGRAATLKEALKAHKAATHKPVKRGVL